ncbi:uncharacterized protein [Bactrocera oleae]|uniref:uncharacterized protein n=1 Tax=Bactrocera oleae TaxID=104688 RepID=UPI0006B704BD|nr:uncharacterized protein LOC106615172 [Bactrocera oleae]XP_036227134.1 uncharacterized protein LOC106615172 [Bactrocera oleae]XP_036227137.1 uncharacterized protein LOC106615172 [Bactrocera oleae]XP_036227140.1 uncharacterized protein LOC106615172 [Bactrocera oleae]
MKLSTLLKSFALILLLGSGTLHAVPLDTIANATTSQIEVAATNAAEVPNSRDEHQNVTPENQTELEAAASEQKPQTLPAVNSGSANGDAANSLYANFLTPEAIQQYISQFGAAYPGYAAYPAPIGYAAAAPPPPPPGTGPIYPGPYVVQTGYEGYLVPAPNTAVEATNNSNSNSLLSPFTYLTNLFSVLMMSALFRVVATVLGAIGMIFFGGALSRFVCNFTPLCTAVEYLKSDNAERVGRIIAEGMTPERVRRATVFVQNAIRKYHELQKFVGSDEKDD